MEGEPNALVGLLRVHDSTAPCLYGTFQYVIVAQFQTSRRIFLFYS